MRVLRSTQARYPGTLKLVLYLTYLFYERAGLHVTLAGGFEASAYKQALSHLNINIAS